MVRALWFPRSSVGIHTGAECRYETYVGTEAPVCIPIYALQGARERGNEEWSRQRRNAGTRAVAGFTLLEMVLVLFLMALVASAGLMLTDGIEDQAKYEETKRRMEMIRKAIVGDPTRTVNGSPEISGFVADMGRLPNDLHELLEAAYCYEDQPTKNDCLDHGAAWHEVVLYTVGRCSDTNYLNQDDCEGAGSDWTTNKAGLAAGWRGPYIQVTPEQRAVLRIRDGYGNIGDDSGLESGDARNSGWTYTLKTDDSIGLASDGLKLTDLNDDITSDSLVVKSDWRHDFSGGINVTFLLPNTSEPKDICMKIFHRVNGEIKELETPELKVTEDGTRHTLLFSGFQEFEGEDSTPVNSIAIGIHAVGIYIHNGSRCTDTFYPSTRSNPIQILFPPRMQLSSIDW